MTGGTLLKFIARALASADWTKQTMAQRMDKFQAGRLTDDLDQYPLAAKRYLQYNRRGPRGGYNRVNISERFVAAKPAWTALVRMTHLVMKEVQIIPSVPANLDVDLTRTILSTFQLDPNFKRS